MSSRRLCTLAALVLVLFGVVGCGKSSRRRSSTNNPPPPPNTLTITSVSPNAGTPAGGTLVTIGGTNFDLATNMTVTFGGTPATAISVISSTSLQCVTPAHAAGVVDVTVNIISPSLTATLTNGYTFSLGGGGGPGSMTIGTVSPNMGPPGTIVTITGTNFANITSVTFGGSPATINQVTSSMIQVTTTFHAAGAVTLVIVSSTNGTVSAANAFTYTSGAGTGTLAVTNVTPNHGPLAGGNVITIDGTAFLPSITVTFAGRFGTNIVVNPAMDQLSVTVPPAIAGFTGGPVNLTVSSSNGTAGSFSLQGYTYDGAGGAPTLATISPNAAPESGGASITITGSNFLQGVNSNISSVLIGGKQLLNIQVINATTLRGTVPPSVAGATTVVAIGTSGASSNSLPFTYTPSLFISTLNPNQGPTSGGGKSVTIRGRNFTATNISQITFAGVPATASQITVINSTTLTVIPPAAPLISPGVPQTGPVNVVLIGAGIANATLINGYNYGETFNAPSISVQPTNQSGTATVGTILAAQFLTSQATGAVSIQPTQAWVHFALDGVTPDVVAIPAGGNNLVDVAVADLNGDSRLDVVALNRTPKTILVAINNANASFNAPVPTAITATGTPVSMAIGLFNNDGFYDVAVSLRAPDEVQIFQGGVGGTLTPVGIVALPAGALPGQILCADPKKSSKDPKQVRDAHDFGAPQGLDMNGDGRADLVVALSGLDQVAVLTQDQTTPFVFALSSTAYVGTGCVFPSCLALGDVDDSGSLDVVVGNTGTNNVTVLRGNGAGAVAFIGSYALLGPGIQIITGLVVGDFNRDCRQDIVTSSFNGQNISIYLGQGDGSYADATNYDSEIAGRRAGAQIQSISYDTQFTAIYAFDSNAQANTNFLTVIQRATILFVQGSITAPPYATLQAGDDPQAITFGDLNKDGKRDIVIANRATATLQVFMNDGLGNFTMPYAPIQTGLQPESVVIADVNNDGLPDVLVACNGSDAVFVHRNLGGGQLAAGTVIPVNARGPHQVVAVDMDGDSNVDFVTVNQYSNSVSCFVNLAGDGVFTAAANFAPVGQPAGVHPVGNAPLGVAVADLNNDGRPEIVTANSSDDTVTVLVRQNTVGVVISPGATGQIDFALGGIIAPAVSQPNGTPSVFIPRVEPTALAIADLNLDGFLDIVTADRFTMTVTILHGGKGGSGVNFFVPTDYGHFGTTTAIGTPPVKLVTPANPVSVILADMNDDGLLDVVVGAFGGSSVVDFITQGRKTQSAATGVNDLNLLKNGFPAPSADVVPAGETAFVFDPKLLQILYKTGALVTFTASNGAPVTAMAVGRLTPDCPPVVGTTAPDKNVRLFKVK